MNTNERNESIRQIIKRLHNELDILCELLLADSTMDLPKKEEAKKSLSEIQKGVSSFSSTNPDSIEITVTQILQELGIPAKLKGYSYLRTAIIESYKDSECLNSITKCLYPKIAKIYDTKPSRVERAIRHAIESGCDVVPPDLMQKYFGCSYSPITGRPTNSLFIFAILDYIKLHQ